MAGKTTIIALPSKYKTAVSCQLKSSMSNIAEAFK